MLENHRICLCTYDGNIGVYSTIFGGCGTECTHRMMTQVKKM